MSAKTNAEVVIDGKVYTLSGYENEEYLQKVAAYINNKIAEFDDMDEYKHLPGNMKSTLIELNIADDYFKAKALVEKLEGDIENKDKEIYDLKHDLISNQVKTENAEASMKELEAQNKELLLNKARLEATLEESLLDGKKPVKKYGYRGKQQADQLVQEIGGLFKGNSYRTLFPILLQVYMILNEHLYEEIYEK